MEPTIIEGRYEITAERARGGCAVVYEAVDRHSNERVALKVLPEGTMNRIALARLAREARTALAINHPNVCRTLDCGLLEDGRPYVAMELLEGETLRDFLARRGRLDAEEAIEIAVQMLAGLEAAHDLGIVHRDVKPENVFLTWTNDRAGREAVTPGSVRVKLVDFGVCRRAADPLDQQTLTRIGYVVGTPGYLAPEQIYGDRAIDPRADLFAVGLVLFEMLTGRPAYEGKNPLELAAALAYPVPAVRSLVRVSMLLDRIVAHATEHEVGFRYACGAHFMHDLLEARTAMRREGSHASKARGPSRSGSGVDWSTTADRVIADPHAVQGHPTQQALYDRPNPRRNVA
jgi:eukaryotic-like serine/threonine-protein kinase